jgi:hypothetical protein
MEESLHKQADGEGGIKSVSQPGGDPAVGTSKEETAAEETRTEDTQGEQSEKSESETAGEGSSASEEGEQSSETEDESKSDEQAEAGKEEEEEELSGPLRGAKITKSRPFPRIHAQRHRVFAVET